MCGERVLCTNCAKIAKALGNSWCYPVAVDVVDRVLLGMESGAQRFVISQEVAAHKCTDHCKHKKTRREYDMISHGSGPLHAATPV